MKERKFEVLDCGNKIVDGNTGLRGLLKFDKPVREILLEIREEERKQEKRKLRLLGLE